MNISPVLCTPRFSHFQENVPSSHHIEHYSHTWRCKYRYLSRTYNHIETHYNFTDNNIHHIVITLILLSNSINTIANSITRIPFIISLQETINTDNILYITHCKEKNIQLTLYISEMHNIVRYIQASQNKLAAFLLNVL